MNCMDCGAEIGRRAAYMGSKRCKSCAQKEVHTRPGYREALLPKLKAIANRPDIKEKKRLAGKLSWATPDRREKHIAAITGEANARWRGGKEARARFCQDCGKQLGPTSAYRGDKYCLNCRFKGPRNVHWRGGCVKDYGPDFTASLKERIRQRDDYICQYPGCYIPQNGKAHQVHHCDYNKKNQNPANLITLCVKHHQETTYGDREYFMELFQHLQEIRGIGD